MAANTATTKLTFSVTLTMPKGSNIPTMREYIREALQSHKCGYDASDVLFGADFSDVKIHLTNKEVHYGKR